MAFKPPVEVPLGAKLLHAHISDTGPNLMVFLPRANPRSSDVTLLKPRKWVPSGMAI